MRSIKTSKSHFMKKIIFSILTLSLLVSCGEAKKTKTPEASPVKSEVVKATKIEETNNNIASKETSNTQEKGDAVAGKKLYTDKGCVACHQEQTKLIGPAVKDIAKIYKEQNADIVTFLKGNGKAIVDTDPGQVAVMKANFAVTKTLSDKQLKDIEAYILSVK